MGQEAFDIEDCVQEKNKQKGDMNMLRKTKRTLSLVLALIMICSTMGVMAFAQERASMYAPCRSDYCQGGYRHFTRYSDEYLVRIIECPLHDRAHDAEEWEIVTWYVCDTCECATDYSYTTYHNCHAR